MPSRIFATFLSAAALAGGGLVAASPASASDGCLPPTPPPPTTAPAATQATQPQGAIAPELVVLQPGQQIHRVYSGNASTGYSWTVSVSPADSGIATADWTVVPPAEPMPGAPSTWILNITAKDRPGDVLVTATYRRPWNNDIAEQHVFHVHVLGPLVCGR